MGDLGLDEGSGAGRLEITTWTDYQMEITYSPLGLADVVSALRRSVQGAISASRGVCVCVCGSRIDVSGIAGQESLACAIHLHCAPPQRNGECACTDMQMHVQIGCSCGRPRRSAAGGGTLGCVLYNAAS